MLFSVTASRQYAVGVVSRLKDNVFRLKDNVLQYCLMVVCVLELVSSICFVECETG